MKLTNQIFFIDITHEWVSERASALIQLFLNSLWTGYHFKFYNFVEVVRSLRGIHRQTHRKKTEETKHMRMPSTPNEITMLEKFSISQFQKPNDDYDDRYEFFDSKNPQLKASKLSTFHFGFFRNSSKF